MSPQAAAQRQGILISRNFLDLNFYPATHYILTLVWQSTLPTLTVNAHREANRGGARTSDDAKTSCRSSLMRTFRSRVREHGAQCPVSDLVGGSCFPNRSMCSMCSLSQSRPKLEHWAPMTQQGLVERRKGPRMDPFLTRFT